MTSRVTSGVFPGESLLGVSKPNLLLNDLNLLEFLVLLGANFLCSGLVVLSSKGGKFGHNRIKLFVVKVGQPNSQPAGKCVSQCHKSVVGRVALWLAAYARKPKVPGSSLAASYVQR